MLFRTSILALALFSGTALAQQSIEEVLITKEKMTQVSDGLYLQKDGESESYVAINQAGRQALTDAIVRSRATMAERFAAGGLNRTEQLALEEMDRSIAELSETVSGAKAQQEKTGYCGTTQIYARAISTGGISSSGYSVASNPSGGAVAATTNYAHATNGLAFYSTTAVGAAPASVSAYDPTACASTAMARVTCPGEQSPKIVAFAFSPRTTGTGCY